ncbi:strabismus protein [Ancylostoma duodenale]|uniref:Strabismus protein n=1 Tax=Ancylostoma duodenale TaxID=51022 RepID=A0A0C2CU43_9BILA|nr:strabismus protein [Ancylostoma duodenale]
MSTVSAGGRRGPPKDFRGVPRGDLRLMKPRGRGYSQSDIGEPFIPRFSAVASEGVKLGLPPEEYGENTTVLTGVTSEHSYNGDDRPIYEPPMGRVMSRRCSRVLWLSAAGLISLVALASAPLMCSLPFGMAFLGYHYPQITCEVDCQGYLLLIAIKTLLLVVALWALYWRRAAADLPRLYFARAALSFFVLFILFAFWLFYTVRIFLERHSNYTYVVTYALSLLDALLYTHYISVIVLELRRLRPEYIVTVVRDPDGESKTMSIGERRGFFLFGFFEITLKIPGMMSLQEAAIQVLRFHESYFPSYNVFLDKVCLASHKVPLTSIRARQSNHRLRNSSQPPGFKMYDIEGLGSGTTEISQSNLRALMEATSRRRSTNHNDILQEECEWERRIKKRKYRLIASAEEAFAQVQSIVDNQAGNKVIVLNLCLSMRLNYRTFLQRFFSDRFPAKDIVSESKWSIISDEQASASIQHGTTFLLRSHNKDDDAGVQLLCTVSSLPFFNLTEQSRSSNNKFALKIRNESSV